MKNKFLYLTKYSLLRKLNSKSFKIANIVILILLVLLVNMDIVIKYFGGDFEEKIEITILNNSIVDEESIENTFINTFKTTDDEIEIDFYEDSFKELKEEIKEDESIGIVIKEKDQKLIASLITTRELNTLDKQLVTASLNEIKLSYQIITSGIDQTIFSNIVEPINIEEELLTDSDSVDDQMDTIMGTIFPMFILPFFMLTIYLVQMLGAEINEEKSTRSMEIVLTAVPAKTHFFSKIISCNLFIILQSILLGLYVMIACFIRSNISPISGIDMNVGILTEILNLLKDVNLIDSLYYMIPIVLILLILSFLAFSLIAGILASITTNSEDFQQIQTPIVIILLLGYYLATMAGLFDGSTLIRILSYVPFLSSMLSPALLLLNQITIIDVIISIIILVLFNYILIKEGIKIYKVGVLNYSSDKLFKKLFKALKK